MQAEHADRHLLELAGQDSRRRAWGTALGWLVELPVAGPRLARGLRAPATAGRLSRWTTRLHAALVRASRGRLRRSWLFAAGQPVMALTTTGRRSGEQRTTAVACFVDGDDLAIAGMNLGQPHDPGWVHNLRAHPAARIVLRGETVEVEAHEAVGEEHDRLWRRWVDLQPSAPAFQRLAGRQIPIFVLTTARES